MSKRNPKFQPGFFTINGLRNKGFDITFARQENRWLVCMVPGVMLDARNDRGDHIAISGFKIKIRNHVAGEMI